MAKEKIKDTEPEVKTEPKEWSAEKKAKSELFNRYLEDCKKDNSGKYAIKKAELEKRLAAME